MNKVVRYECPHCKKLFKKDKHFCFKDPINRACASCEGWNDYELDKYYDSDGEKQERAWCSLTGDLIHTKYHRGNDGQVQFEEYHGNRGYMCPHWEKRRVGKDD